MDYDKIKELIKASKFNFEHGFYNVSVVLAEEALYVFLVYQLLKYDVKIPWYLDFDGLLRILEKYNTKASEFRKDRLLVKTLDQIRITFRYSIYEEIKKDEAEKILSFVENIINSLSS